MESTNLEPLPLPENDEIVIPLGEDRLVKLHIQFDKENIKDVATTLAQLLAKQLNADIVECLIHYGLQNNVSKDIDELLRYITLYQLDKLPIISPLEVFSKIERGS